MAPVVLTPEQHAEELRARVHEAVDGALAGLVASLAAPADQVAILSYAASAVFMAHASAVKDAFVVAWRAEHPGTYEQTAEELGMTTASVNRAVVRHGKRQ